MTSLQAVQHPRKKVERREIGRCGSGKLVWRMGNYLWEEAITGKGKSGRKTRKRKGRRDMKHKRKEHGKKRFSVAHSTPVHTSLRKDTKVTSRGTRDPISLLPGLVLRPRASRLLVNPRQTTDGVASVKDISLPAVSFDFFSPQLVDISHACLLHEWRSYASPKMEVFFFFFPLAHISRLPPCRFEQHKRPHLWCLSISIYLGAIPRA